VKKPSKVVEKKKAVGAVTKAKKSSPSAKSERPRKRPSGEPLFDYKKIQKLCDFRTPISEWAIPMLEESGLKTSELGERIKLEQVTSAFENALNFLCRFIRQGNFDDSAKLIPLILATAQGRVLALEKIFPEFGRLQVTNRITAEFVKEADRNRKIKKIKRHFISDKDKYRESCESEILTALILQRAGWKRHWLLGTPFPPHEFGSATGKNDWRAWIRVYLTALHNHGLLRSNPETRFSKEGNAKDRSKKRDDYFEAIYAKAADPFFESFVKLHHDQLQMHAALKTLPNCFSFLTVMAEEHPECAPKGFVPQRIKLPEGLC
jgi:hypothetical protein